MKALLMHQGPSHLSSVHHMAPDPANSRAAAEQYYHVQHHTTPSIPPHPTPLRSLAQAGVQVCQRDEAYLQVQHAARARQLHQ